MKDIKDIVLEILERDYKARGNDEHLIAEVYKSLGLPTDLENIATLGKKRVSFGTITRWGRKWRACYPHLQPSKEIQELRDKQITKHKEIAKDSDMIIMKTTALLSQTPLF